MLPVIKDTVNKLEKVYRFVGYRISIPTGKLGIQNKNHFYMRIIPKYKKHYGCIGTPKTFVPATPEQAKTVQEALKPIIKQDNVIGEEGGVIARLHNELHPGCIVLSTKNRLTNDIDIKAMDPNT